MVLETSLLIVLVLLVDRIPVPPRPKQRGRPPVYPDRLFLKVLVMQIGCLGRSLVELLTPKPRQMILALPRI